MGEIAELAVNTALKGNGTFCKFMSANDSGETGGHQVGFLLSKSARHLFFTDEEINTHHICKRDVEVKWQGDFITKSCLTWYESKNELRLTRFGRGFPLMGPEFTGALLVLVKQDERYYDGFVLNSEEEIEQFLDSFGLTPAETNRPIDVSNITSEAREAVEIQNFIGSLTVEFPTSEEMSAAARLIYYQITLDKNMVLHDPDKALLCWTEEEYRLFRAVEQSRYGDAIVQGFSNVDDFVRLANKVLNRRKSRAGKSLEHHLAAIFDERDLRYTPQAVTEGNKRPDFIFPSVEAYHDAKFSIDGICSLAAKTTCKDRWRQVLNEADRLRDRNKYLCTLQQGISGAQMDEMEKEKVILVVPKPYIKSYPKDRQNRIWTLEKFIDFVQSIES